MPMITHFIENGLYEFFQWWGFWLVWWLGYRHFREDFWDFTNSKQKPKKITQHLLTIFYIVVFCGFIAAIVESGNGHEFWTFFAKFLSLVSLSYFMAWKRRDLRF
jgi:hypothetical protein